MFYALIYISRNKKKIEEENEFNLNIVSGEKDNAKETFIN